MTTLPNNIIRFTGANTFTAEDSVGNIFYAFQKQDDAGCVVMVRPDGAAFEVFALPAKSGRPCFECNPTRGLWLIGNKETGSRSTPPRYPIVQYVPFPATGGITLLDAPRTALAWDGRELSGGVWVDIPAVFGVPSASAYLVRFVAQASKADVRVRAGTELAPAFLTMNTQVTGVQVHTQGWAPGPRMYISTVNGAAQVWLQVVGWSG